jgi:flavin reductase (DIM6/NTAB) family NADH-FMN oxidoreductase RutF
MFLPQDNPTAPFNTRYFPLHIALLTVASNLMPMGNWMVISKKPFRFLLAMGVGNHSLSLLKKHKEACLHFLPWSERQKVVHAGHISGRTVDKASLLGFTLLPAAKLQITRLVQGADAAFELVVNRELPPNLSREFALFIMDVVHTHGTLDPTQRQPLLYLSDEDFATLSDERWVYKS